MQKAAFNWFPNEHSQESPHFLYFGCDPYLPNLAEFLQPKLRYLGSDEDIICLDTGLCANSFEYEEYMLKAK